VVGAGLAASSMALVLSLFETGDRVKAMGWWSMVGAGGPVLGVAIGGVIIESVGWRAMFVLEMILGAVALVLALAVLPEHGAGQKRHAREGAPRLDVIGAVFVVVSVGSLLFALNRAPVVGFGSNLVIGALCLAVLAGAVLLFVELRVEDPLVPFHYLRRRNFVLPLSAQTFGNFAYMGGFFLAPLLLEQVYHYGESASGLLVIARPIAFAIFAPVAGYVAVRVGERPIAVLGTCAVVASMAAFALTPARGGLPIVEVALVLSGVGMGVASPSISASIANVVDQDALGTASAAQQLVVQIGTVAGIQVSQTVQGSALSRHPSALLGSFHAAFVVGGAVALVGVISAIGLRSTDRQGRAARGARSGRAARGEKALLGDVA
jgi:MFS family permease